MGRTTARQRVLEYVRRGGPITATQTGRGLGMSAATVRHHLSILCADGLILADGTAPKSNRGRPEKLYRLSDRAAGDNLTMLSDLTLTRWLAGIADEQRGEAVAVLAQGLAAQIGAIDDRLPATKRLVLLIEGLNRLHYQARWEAGAEGPRILFGHCPYAAIIDRHPELCTMDTVHLTGMLKAQVKQLSKIDRKSGDASQCVFAVRGSAAKPRG